MLSWNHINLLACNIKNIVNALRIYTQRVNSGMSSSSQYYNNRNTLELKVGKKATIQLQLHLRACDIQWFNDDSKEYIAEILSLVSSNVIPTLFEEKQEDETKADSGSSKTAGVEKGSLSLPLYLHPCILPCILTGAGRLLLPTSPLQPDSH